jgi:hypothetical protein
VAPGGGDDAGRRAGDALPVRVQVGGVHAAVDEALGDGGPGRHPVPRRCYLPGGYSVRPPVPPGSQGRVFAVRASRGGHGGAVELVAARPRPGRGERGVSGGDGVAVAERERGGHRRLDVEHAAHRVPVQGAGQVQQTGALGDDGRARGGQRRHLRPQALVGRQLAGVLLGEAAPDDQAVGAVGEALIPQRVHGDDLGPGRGEQLGVLGVAEGERLPGRQREAGERGSGDGSLRGMIAGGGERAGRAG